MNDVVARLSKQALDYAAEQYGPQRAGEKVWDPLTYDRKFAELIVMECVKNLEIHSTCFDGDVGRGIKTAARLTKEHFNIMVGADHMSDKGYQIGTQEGYDTFMSKRNG